MKVNLYINYYVDGNPKRHQELAACFVGNARINQIDRFIVFISKHHLENMNNVLNSNGLTNEQKGKIIPIIKEERPTYNEYFKLTQDYPDDINIIANTDIVMDEGCLLRLKKWKWRNHCLALSRWDYIYQGLNNRLTRHYRKRDSQDTWMLHGSFPLIPEANFTLGVAGCDNKIALLLKNYFHVINPSDDIKTYHYHLTGIRNYKDNRGEVIYRLPPPYHLVIPQKLPR